jgi:carotenoid 1,2-hydratase
MRRTDDRAAAPLRPDPLEHRAHDHNPNGFPPAVSSDGRRPLRPGEPRGDGLLSATGRADSDSGAVSGGRLGASGSGRANGGALGPIGGALASLGPRFDQQVAAGGYLWWYLDAVSDDGAYGFSIIWFIGSVFSPYYFWSGYRAPENHVAVNVALYGRGARRWTMTERKVASLSRDQHNFTVGPSSLRFDGDTVVMEIDEIGAPIPKRARGRIRLHPTSLNTRRFAIDVAGKHGWMPIAPTARVEVELSDPALRWKGHGYFDTNAGDEPIANGFRSWDWSRADIDGACVALYDAVGKDGINRQIATRFIADGNEDFTPPPRMTLPATAWGIKRQTQSDGPMRLVSTLENTPFYARSLLETTLLGKTGLAMHETLDVRRFDSTLTRLMLPWRMPRRFL